MGTSLPADHVKTSADNSLDDPKQWRSETAANTDKFNALLTALGVVALYDLGDGIGVDTQGSGFNDLLKIKTSSSFRFTSGGNLEPNDFFILEADDDVATHFPPSNIILRRQKTGISSGDILGEYQFRGSNAAAKSNDIIYAIVSGTVTNPAAGSEAGRINFQTISSGAKVDRFRLLLGLYGRVSGSDVAGGDKGEGTGNFQDLYRRGVLLPIQTGFESAEVTPVLDAINAMGAHGLGGLPKNTHVVLRCKTTEHGYSVDDEATPVIDHNNADEGFTVVADATDINIIVGSALRVHSQSTFNISNITLGNWALVVYAQG